MSFEQIVKVPLDRVGVLIGKGGSTMKSFEEKLGVEIVIDSKEGSVTVRAASFDSGDPLTAVRVVEAIGRGFSPHRARKLFDEDTAFEVIDLRDFAGKSDKAMERIRGRIIGLNGKSRRVIEELTECYISVYGRTVSIIGGVSDIQLASEAVRMLASGSPHKTVFNVLQKARSKRKLERIFIWEEDSPEKIAADLKKLEG
ncbi:MAG: KH domain-containing protein [Thaumarchaeota archaeon]|nr:KH domain-containing protein [Nitrososphaerota archaeon]